MENIVLQKRWVQGGNVVVDDLRGTMIAGEAGAHTFQISGVDSAQETVAITGTITGRFLTATNVTVPLTGSVSDGVASLTLTEDCYVVPGRFVLSVYATNGSTTQCIYCAVGNVFRTQSEIIEYPSASIPDIEQIIADAQAAVTEINAEVTAAQAAVAAAQTAVDGIEAQRQTMIEAIASVAGQGTDTTLSQSGVAADAKATGDEVSALKSAFERDSSIISANLMGVDVQQNLYPGAADWSGTWFNSDSANLKLSETKYNGYPVYHSTQGWRIIRKVIPVEAGKTYTFSAWIRLNETGTAFIYIIPNEVTNPATVDSNMSQFNNTSANVWHRFTKTFTCTASGDISPYCMSNKAFDVAMYELVEGDSIFSLSDALDSKVDLDEVSGVGDYLKYVFSIGTSSGQYWNPVINKAYPAGTKCRLVFDSYSGQYLSYIRVDGIKTDQTYTNGLCQIDNPVRGGSAEFTTSEAYVGFRIQHYRTTTESNVSSSIYFATDKSLGLTYDNLHTFSQRVYHVEKDGSGDFTSLVEAVNTACQSMDSIVYVGAGTWDIVSELGETYLNGVSSSQRGLYLKNRVHIICSSEALITCNYTGTREDTITWLSAFNAGEYGFTLENARIESSKCRYAIHDERGTAEDAYTNKYLNCNIKHDNTSGGYIQCIGGGLGKDGHIVISGCVFENPNANNGDIVSYHNTWYAGGTGKSNVEMTGCYFKGTTTFRASWFGASQEISEFIVHDNSVGYPIIHRVENQSMMDDNPTWIQNTELLGWNNVVRD